MVRGWIDESFHLDPEKGMQNEVSTAAMFSLLDYLRTTLTDRQRNPRDDMFTDLVNGEIVDEDALADALERDHLRGAALDVYVGEFEHTPTSRLWSDPRVLITPHISSASDQDRHGAIDLFCDNLRAYLEGGPLRNVIDWDRGY